MISIAKMIFSNVICGDYHDIPHADFVLVSFHYVFSNSHGVELSMLLSRISMDDV